LQEGITLIIQFMLQDYSIPLSILCSYLQCLHLSRLSIDFGISLLNYFCLLLNRSIPLPELFIPLLELFIPLLELFIPLLYCSPALLV